MNTSDYRPCRQCGEYFHADQDWKHICIACFKANKQRERDQEEGKQGREYREYRQHHKPHTPPATAIPPDMLRVLIMLCHPDKHSGKESATRATQWLLSQRTISNG